MSEFQATAEQQAIIEAPLKSLAVVACPGSGKTATAVRRVAEIRRRLEVADSRGHVALLSFSNIAVDTFRNEYRKLRGRDVDSDHVVIQTVDSFLTTFILRPHGYRAMKCSRTPYLVLGTEPFLSSFRFGDKKNPIGLDELAFDLEDGTVVVHRMFKNGGAQRLDALLTRTAKQKVVDLAEKGAYTHRTGRLWALVLLKNEPRITKALARRFPHILVDEAQDIGPFEGVLLNKLSAAGSTISLVGDFHQSIYSFNFATGEYLRKFSSRADVLRLPLTQNRRSVEHIVKAANLLAGTDSTHFRTPPARLTGAYFWRYDLKTLPEFMSSWVSTLNATGYAIDEAAVLCRGSGLLAKLSTETSLIGRSAVKHFAAAAIEREQAVDISKVLEHCAKGVMAIVSSLPDSFISDVNSMHGGADMKMLRRLMWPLIRTPATGIPRATLAARTSWLVGLKKNLSDWLTLVEQETTFTREPTWSKRVTAAELPKTGPLIAVDIGQHDWSALRCGTVHSAKGEGIPAVMYLTNKGDLDALVAGTGDEEGRIGFVAVTRGRDLLVVAIPSETSDEVVTKLKACGFADSCPEQLAAVAAVVAVPGTTVAVV
uniref:ATP-dependent helicase n=1 Tax=Castellaniella defragrans TaxID=75697 RepID=UPI003341564F